MHLNPYGEYTVTLAASLADDPPADRQGIVARTRDFGMTADFGPAVDDDHLRTMAVIQRWLTVVDADDPAERAALLNAPSSPPRRRTRGSPITTTRAGTCTTGTTGRPSPRCWPR